MNSDRIRRSSRGVSKINGTHTALVASAPTNHHSQKRYCENLPGERVRWGERVGRGETGAGEAQNMQWVCEGWLDELRIAFGDHPAHLQG
jgi:hypothetical protein